MDPIDVEPLHYTSMALMSYGTYEADVPAVDTSGQQSPSLIIKNPSV